ncbi:hypothetical protein NP493_777g01014 [Ridgeia piscesae]|uniref:Uncharacterized protein n=1 Tax=Ridgeia piscesae TaxID=27915 RepID=A0AAD9NNF6_RIDPI|nr:hypothetical protein NP493_777g01014 [Ridgeia piscesae]
MDNPCRPTPSPSHLTPHDLSKTSGATVHIGLVVQLVQRRGSPADAVPLFSGRLMLRRQIMFLTWFYVDMLVINNLCMKSVGVPFYQISRSITLAFTVLFVMLILRQAVSAKVRLCCGLVVAGDMFGVDQDKFVRARHRVPTHDERLHRAERRLHKAFVLLAPVVVGSVQAHNVVSLGLLGFLIG